MKLSTRGRYALRLMIDIAELGNQQPRHLGDIAARQNISKRYLEHIVVSLKNNSLIRSTAGKHGGFVLARPPEEITVGDIIEAAIGTINIVDCVMEPDICMSNDFCECRKVYEHVNGRVREALNETTLADITHKFQDQSGTDIAALSRTACPLPRGKSERHV